MSSAFGGSRTAAPRPPEKGVFPLDHFGDCKKLKEQYVECLSTHNSEAPACKEVAKAYLECRMRKNLMAEQSLEELGFGERRSSARRDEARAGEDARPESSGEGNPRDVDLERQRKGFVAGTRRVV